MTELSGRPGSSCISPSEVTSQIGTESAKTSRKNSTGDRSRFAASPVEDGV
jgi:hypothetical protein